MDVFKFDTLFNIGIVSVELIKLGLKYIFKCLRLCKGSVKLIQRVKIAHKGPVKLIKRVKIAH